MTGVARDVDSVAAILAAEQRRIRSMSDIASFLLGCFKKLRTRYRKCAKSWRSH